MDGKWLLLSDLVPGAVAPRRHRRDRIGSPDVVEAVAELTIEPVDLAAVVIA